MLLLDSSVAQTHLKPKKETYISIKDTLPTESSICTYLTMPESLISSAILVFGGPGVERASFSKSAKVGALLSHSLMPLGSDCGLELSAAFILALFHNPSAGSLH